MTQSLSEQTVLRPLMMYGGAFHPAVGGEVFESANPVDSSPLAEIPFGDERDATLAVDAAAAALPSWSRLTAAERARHLHRVADILEARRN